MVKAMWIALAIAIGSIVLPAPIASTSAHSINEEQEWAEFNADAYDEYADEFTRLFNSYTYKLSKNGRSMVNGKFVAMPKGK